MFEVGRVLVGSQNYHLDGPDSDRDYKVLMCPDLDDLYFRNRAEKNDLPDKYKSDSEHYNVMDVRTFGKNVLDGNVNALEMLFSVEPLDFCVSLYHWTAEVRKLYQDGYLVTVFPHFLVTMKGLVFNSLNRYGLNRKTVSRALYFCNFAEYLATNNFQMSWNSWRDLPVVASAVSMRFDDTVSLLTREQLENRFDCLETYTLRVATEVHEKLTFEQVNTFDTRQKNLFNKMKDLVVLQLF